MEWDNKGCEKVRRLGTRPKDVSQLGVPKSTDFFHIRYLYYSSYLQQDKKNSEENFHVYNYYTVIIKLK